MTSPLTLQAVYSDCFEAMDAALADTRGVRLLMKSMDEATYFRLRIHKARAKMREQNEKVYPVDDPNHGTSDYDGLSCRIRRDKDKLYLYIEQRPSLSGLIEPLAEVNDEPVDAREATPPTIKIARRL